MKTTSIYLRVSTTETDKKQDPENQLAQLKKWANGLDLEIVKTYTDYVSGGSANRPQFQQMLQDAKRHKFDCLLIWSLDRFSREGISNTISYIEKLKASNVIIKSLQETWLDTSNESVSELLLAIFSWVAKQERVRISERTKAGLQKAVASGIKLGRPFGAVDKKRRIRSGYLARFRRDSKVSLAI